jgi:uncharacterized protein
MDRDLIERTFQAANWRPIHAASDFTARETSVGTLENGQHIPERGAGAAESASRGTIAVMGRDDILRTIAANQQRLHELGVRELVLFGSYARGDQNASSDVDFVVDLTKKSFDRYMDVKELLEALLGRRVDLVLKSALKPRLRDSILREAVRAA